MKTDQVYYLNPVIVSLRDPLKELQSQVQPQDQKHKIIQLKNVGGINLVCKLYEQFRSRKGTFLERRHVYVDRTGI